MRVLTKLVLLLSMALVAWGCGDDSRSNSADTGGAGGEGGDPIGGPGGSGGTDSIDPQVIEVRVNPAGVQLFEGDVAQLEAEIVTEDGAEVNADLIWASDDESVATVDHRGAVIAVGGGAATITATAGGKSGSATVEVELLKVDKIEVVPPSTLSIINGAVTLHVDLGFKFTTKIYDSNDKVLMGRRISWRVEEDGEPLAGWVDEDGVVVPRWPGRYQVIASAGGRSAAFTFNSVLRFREVAPGKSRTCALSTGNKAWCWGDDWAGQLGLGQFVTPRHRIDEPQRVAGDHDFKTITGGFNHSCAIDFEGRAWCWGKASNGEILADGEASAGSIVIAREPKLVEPVVKPLVSIAARGTSTCALSEGRELICWGSIVEKPWALAEVNAFDIEEFSLGWNGDFVCFRSELGLDSKLHCFGENGKEQVTSDEEIVERRWDGGLYARHVTFGYRGYTSIAAGSEHACVTVSILLWVDGPVPANETFCWGAGEWGQTGSPGYPESSNGVRVGYPEWKLGGLSQLGAGESFTCGLLDGDVYCWGREGAGIGESWYYLPTKVPLPQKVSTLAVGERMACVLTNEPSPILYCWGDNAKGALGVSGELDSTLTPMKVLSQ